MHSHTPPSFQHTPLMKLFIFSDSQVSYMNTVDTEAEDHASSDIQTLRTRLFFCRHFFKMHMFALVVMRPDVLFP